MRTRTNPCAVRCREEPAVSQFPGREIRYPTDRLCHRPVSHTAGRIQSGHEKQRKNADREIEVEDPAPGVVIGNPYAKGWAQNRRQQNSYAEGRHGVSMTLFGKRLQ